jgi:hypothetical protein
MPCELRFYAPRGGRQHARGAAFARGGEGWFVVVIESRLWHALRSFLRRLLYARYPPIATSPVRYHVFVFKPTTSSRALSPRASSTSILRIAIAFENSCSPKLGVWRFGHCRARQGSSQYDPTNGQSHRPPETRLPSSRLPRSYSSRPHTPKISPKILGVENRAPSAGARATTPVFAPAGVGPGRLGRQESLCGSHSSYPVDGSTRWPREVHFLTAAWSLATWVYGAAIRAALIRCTVPTPTR